ncbi:peptide/nickel transport system ATP-binding protein [Virgibacillus subterraneus]|uniref:Peptide/nickel transport system ATP-binding protein n=1 Tax=Virgibacillus subterraneus TaxID=621109 RepID=A0A1H9G5X1_9BACI|nr:ABC transporter ATP-binding protein [Virgibacillus subterraneus]SEQ45471.1 peptide/nickel transport system ATP-binding protein [Virgibacillus subterraneus]
MSEQTILKVKNLQTQFTSGNKTVNAVNNVSFSLKSKKTLGIVGESGCGKSVTVHSITQLLPPLGKITDGKVTYIKNGNEIELSGLKKQGRQMRSIRGKEIGMIFQDPNTSLNPVYTIGNQIVENILQHEKITKKHAIEKAADMLNSLGIPMAHTRMNDYPHQFSGGMKQRVGIAMAMVSNPSILIADEPTTALDVTIQSQILELMKRIQEDYGTSIIFITHNLGIVANMADELAVMYMGKIVEYGSTRQVLTSPKHPYTEALLQSVPFVGMDKEKRLKSIKGSTPDPSSLPEGCSFASRCEFATEECKVFPNEFHLGDGHHVKCWLYKDKEVSIKKDGKRDKIGN